MKIERLKTDRYKVQSPFAVLAVGSGACTCMRHVSGNEYLRQNVHFLFCDSVPEGCGHDRETGRRKAQTVLETIDESLGRRVKKVIVVATLGGGTGTGGAPLIAEHLAKTGRGVCSMLTLPFGFEGGAVMEQALQAVAGITRCSRTTVVLNEEELRKCYKSWKVSAYFNEVEKCMTEILLEEIRPHGVGYDSTVIIDRYGDWKPECCNAVPWFRRLLARFGRKERRDA